MKKVNDNHNDWTYIIIFYTLDCKKLDKWATIMKDDLSSLEWLGSSSSEDDGSTDESDTSSDEGSPDEMDVDKP